MTAAATSAAAAAAGDKKAKKNVEGAKQLKQLYGSGDDERSRASTFFNVLTHVLNFPR